MIDTSNFLKLLELVKQNPQMPVFPIVSGNICDAKDFSEDFSLCHFEEPYIAKFCEYMLYDKLQFIIESKKDLITEDVIKNNQGRLPEWEKGIFIPIKPAKKYSKMSKNVSNVGGYVSDCYYSCDHLRCSVCRFDSHRYCYYSCDHLRCSVCRFNLSDCYYSCDHLRCSVCRFNSHRCGQRNLPYSMTMGINEGYSE